MFYANFLGLHGFSELFPGEEIRVGIISLQMRESDFCFQNRLKPRAMFELLQQHLLKYDDRVRFFKYFISVNIL